MRSGVIQILTIFLIAFASLSFTSCSLVDLNAPEGTGAAIGKVGDGVSDVGDGLGKIGDSIQNAGLSPFPPSPTTTLTEAPIKLKHTDGTFKVSGEFVENAAKDRKWKLKVLEWKEENLVQ